MRYRLAPIDQRANENSWINITCLVACSAIITPKNPVDWVPAVIKNHPPWNISSIFLSSDLWYKNRMLNEKSDMQSQKLIAAYQNILAVVCRWNTFEKQTPAKLIATTMVNKLSVFSGLSSSLRVFLLNNTYCVTLKTATEMNMARLAIKNQGTISAQPYKWEMNAIISVAATAVNHRVSSE